MSPVFASPPDLQVHVVSVLEPIQAKPSLLSRRLQVVFRTVEHAQATSEKAAKADVGTFSMAAATQRVAVAASALAWPLGPS